MHFLPRARTGMKAQEGNGSETRRRTNPKLGRTHPRRRPCPWWGAPLAIFVAAVILASAGGILTRPSGPTTEWSAIDLSFGSDPVSQNLVVSFARVAYIDQPTEFNTTGLAGATVVALNGSWESNSSGYGILQFNDSSSKYVVSHWNLGSYLGANVSYAFVDQRVALNGTTGSWSLVLSESNVSTAMPTSGNVTNAAAGAAQNALWLTATAGATGDTYSFAVHDFEEKSGGYQTYTTEAFPGTANQSALQFFDIYFYAEPTQTVVSIVNTTDAKVVASETVHPVLEKNLTKLGYLTDELTA
ncbi:MAG: hypothetical protein ACREDK_08185, partial [Thermoplasmata archaeon]